jgi:molybdopterin-guanine dinucleotide biosynthesis protein A/molybdopterin converting factor small subunit
MGQPKALLPFAGEPLIVHTVRILRQRFSDVVVVAAPEQELPALPVTLVRDAVAYQGPVSGIYYGLQAAQADVCFVTSCDAPFLNLPVIAYLLSLITDYEVVVPHWQGRLQPLHAVYRRSVAPFLYEQLQKGELRPIFLYPKVQTREVSEEEIRRFDPEGLSLRNMNTPEDYQAALALWQAERQRIQTETENPGDRESRLRIHPEADSSIPVPNLYLTCTVELFGVARLKAKTDRVSLTLPAGAHLVDALAALAVAVPALVGPVLTADSHILTAGYACNLNGTDFSPDLATLLHSGDSLLILSSDAGG